MGPWSRSFLAAVAGNAERPDLEVSDLRIEPGVISARVEGCEVTLTAAPIPQRIWTAMTRYAKGMGQLEDAVEGRVQSVHLEHLLEEDWGEQLVPRPRAIARSCSCDEDAACEHVVAVAYRRRGRGRTFRTGDPALAWRGGGPRLSRRDRGRSVARQKPYRCGEAAQDAGARCLEAPRPGRY